MPVVAADGTATAEALDDGRSGLLAAPTADAFAAASRELAGRRAEMRARRARVRAPLRLGRLAGAVADVYRGLVR